MRSGTPEITICGDARVMALQSGEADLNLQDIPSESFSIIQADKNLSTEQQVSTLSYYLIENYDTPALQDINVRQALNYATNKESIKMICWMVTAILQRTYVSDSSLCNRRKQQGLSI